MSPPTPLFASASASGSGPVRVVRGSVDDPETGLEVVERLAVDAAAGGPPAVRIWRPPPHVAFGRRDVASPAYPGAAAVARTAGLPPVERPVGGRAVAFTGSTLALAAIVPVEDARRGLDARYDAVSRAVQRALWSVGVRAKRGEPADSFCPGRHALRAGGKLAGFGQRLRAGVAVVGGLVIVDDADEVAAVLDRIYGVLGLSFDPGSVGSVADAGGREDPNRLAAAIETRLVGGRSTEIEPVDAWVPTPDAADG